MQNSLLGGGEQLVGKRKLKVKRNEKLRLSEEFCKESHIVILTVYFRQQHTYD